MTIRYSDRTNNAAPKKASSNADLTIALFVGVFVAALWIYQLSGAELFGIWW